MSLPPVARDGIIAITAKKRVIALAAKDAVVAPGTVDSHASSVGLAVYDVVRIGQDHFLDFRKRDRVDAIRDRAGLVACIGDRGGAA